ncbi:hypothetical protein ACFQMF_12775 [Halorubrum rutilum]|uniref:Uncharacterized protein n=1 Tax=Halorubrum rutilum TaxID=1364933 RepID=A0ABD6AQ13_9EURY|nr:hypothetical protein [Halorubrum rutilum]
MPGVDHGFERGLSVVVEAVVTAIILGKLVPVLVEAGLLPKYVFSLFMMASIFGAVMMIGNAKYWSFGYLAGVCLGIPFGLGAFLQTGFLGASDYLLLLLTLAGAIALKAKIHT